jgi:hypothetical protein
MKIQIEFKERPIHRAPLAVLEHLYYYTAQYGLSVKQFTGKHWKYWEKLPARLRKVKDDRQELEAIIEELESLAEDSERRRERRQAQREWRWAEKEVVLNAQLLSVLAALPEQLLAGGFQYAMGMRLFAERLRIVDLRMQGHEGQHIDFVEPDLLLMGDDYLLMVEIKTRGGSSSARDYPPYQLLNYLQLVAMCREFQNASTPRKFVHLILVPSTDTKWLEKQSEWILEASDEEGRLKVDADACIRLSKKKSSYDYEVLRQLAKEIPIYYRSWEQLYEAFKQKIRGLDESWETDHFRKVVEEIGELSKRAGKFK